MIPGAREVRDDRPIVPAIWTDAPVLSTDEAGSCTDRERLDRAREGGGAPSQRRTRPPAILEKIWRYIMRS
jgi:hypothetical protein